MLEFFSLILVSIFLSIAVQAWMGARAGRPPSLGIVVAALVAHLWALLTLIWFAPGGIYLAVVMGPVALVPFAAVSISGLVLSVRLWLACSYLLRGVDAGERIRRIVRYSHAHHLAVVVVFGLASAVMAVSGGNEALALIVFVSIASGIGGLVGAALGTVGLSDRAPSRYSLSDAEEAA
jgi:hypothetical protein